MIQIYSTNKLLPCFHQYRPEADVLHFRFLLIFVDLPYGVF